MKPVILSLGEVLWDQFPQESRFGGAPANFACHSAAMGASVFMASALGDDREGRRALEVLRSYDVDTSLIQMKETAPTGTVAISLNASGQPTFSIGADAAWDKLAQSLELETQIRKCDAVYFGTLGQRGSVSRITIRNSMEAAKNLGILRILDLNLRAPFYDAPLIRDSVELCNVLKFNDDEFKKLLEASDIPHVNVPEKALQALLNQYALDLVVMTRGAAGATLVSPTETVDQSGIAVQVRDTVGAGDAFTAALTVGLLRKDPLTIIARNACEIAAAVCSQSGAVPDISNPISNYGNTSANG